MKKIILFSILIVFGMQSNFATSFDDKYEIINASIAFTKTAGNTTESLRYKYDDLNKLETFDFGILNTMFNTNADDCEVTATVSVTASFSIAGNVGVASSGQQSSITVSAEVTASCDEIDDAVRSLIAKLKRILGL